MDIIKQLNKDVWFVEDGQTIAVLSETVTANLNDKRNGIVLVDEKGRKIEFFTQNVKNTQKLPAAASKFPPKGTIDLWDLLFNPVGSPFFEEQHIKYSVPSSGGAVESNITTIAVATYTALNTDYILWVKANSTITLPSIVVAGIGRVYRVFARNVNVTINANPADSINGAASITLKKYDSLTLRAGEALNWGVGD